MNDTNAIPSTGPLIKELQNTIRDLELINARLLGKNDLLREQLSDLKAQDHEARAELIALQQEVSRRGLELMGTPAT